MFPTWLKVNSRRWMTTLLLLAIVAALIGGVQSAAAQPEPPAVPEQPSRLMLPLMMNGASPGTDPQVQPQTEPEVLFVIAPSSTGASVTTDQSDYPPGAIVTIIGAGWASGEVVHITVNDDVGQTWSHTSNPDPVAALNGTFTYQFQLPNWFVANYGVLATGPLSGSASTTFTDLSVGTYDQCSNDLGAGYTSGDTGCRWINGNLQSNNSIYFEGDATVQRVWLTGFLPGSTHSLTLKYGTTKGGKHAYDFLTTWDWSEDWVTVADRCQGIDGCETFLTESKLDIPQDPSVPASFEPSAPGERQFVMRGGVLNSATQPAITSGDYTGDSETVITVNFTVASSGSMCPTKGPDSGLCGVALWFGAHVAAQANWGLGLGAGSISGSPYHVALDAVDNASVGQRDNQMQANVVTFVPNGTIVIVKDAVPNSPLDFNFNLNNNSTIGQTFQLDDDDDPTLPNSQTFSVPPGMWYASELLPLPTGWSLTGLSCQDPSNNTTVDLDNLKATINLASNETVICTFVDSLGSFNLTATKTATTSYSRTYSWVITKGVDDDLHTGVAGDTFTSNYEVAVARTATEADFIVAGTIVVGNPSPFAVNFSISDDVGGTAATVKCPGTDNNTGTVPAAAGGVPGTVTCTYSAGLASKTNGTNTAMVTSSTPEVGGAAASVPYSFGEPTKVNGFATVNVNDTFPYPGGTTTALGSASDSFTFPAYSHTFDCPTDPSLYNGGAYEYKVPNQAEIVETEQTALATVSVKCTLPGLVVSKTAAGTYDRTVTWKLTKSASPAEHVGYAGDTFQSTWTVVADKTEVFGNYKVAGTVTVENPAPVAQAFSVADVLDNGTVVNVACPGTGNNTGTVPAASGGVNGKIVCTYEVMQTDTSAKLNTATMTVSGNVTVVATAAVEWAERLIGYDSGTLSDERFVGAPWNYTGETISGDTTKAFDEQFSCPTDALAYKDGVYEVTYANTAKLNGNLKLEASADVHVKCTLPGLVVSKTAAGTYDRTVTWKLTKSASPAEHVGYAGDTFQSTWTVVADKTEVFGNYKVAGTVTVENPAPVAQAFSVADVLDNGTAVTVKCPVTNDNTGTVPAASGGVNGKVVCTYEVMQTGTSAKLNTATVTAAGNADKVATVDFGWTETLYGYDSGTLSDARFGYSKVISGDKTETFAEAFTCPTDASLYKDGKYTSSVTNNAHLNNNINLDASATVNVECTLPGLVVSKTAAGTYDRTVTWKLTKSASPAEHVGYAGDTFQSTWTVVADKTEVFGNYKVAGTVTVENPAPVAQAFSVADVLDNGTAVTVKCPVTNDNTGTVPAASGGVNGKIVCTYEVMQTDTSAKLNTATVTAAGNADKVATVDFGWTETLYGYDSGTLSDARFGYSKVISGDKTETFAETFTCPTDASLYKDGKYTSSVTNNAHLNNNINLDASATVNVECTLPGLVVSKTAAGTYDRTVTWKLTKSASPAEHVGYAGDTFQSTWTVVADKTEVFGNYKVAGTVTVENPAPVAQAFSVADVLDNGTAVTVKCPVTNDNTGTVPAASGGVNGKVVCTYEVMQTDTSAKLNTATVTAAGNADKVATVDFGWTETLYGYDSGTLSDARFGYSKVISGDKTETFAETFTCPTDASLYKDGKYTSSVTNNAHLNDNINLDASATVNVECTLPGLVVSKTAAGTYDRTVTWKLTKSASPAEHVGYAGDTFQSTWTVVADKTEVFGNYKVAGTVTVENPAPVAQAFSVADVLDNGTAVTVKCPVTNDNTGTVPAASGGVNGKVVCTYEVMQTDTSAKLNTATVTAAGNADKVATVDFGWTETLYGYDSGTLSDARFGYSKVISGDKTETFAETFTCPTDASLYKDGKYTSSVTNNAHLNDNINLDASATVNVECTLPGLVVSKTAAGTYDRTVTWKLTKSASPAEHVGYAGDTFQSTWTVVADKTEVFGNYKVAGAVTVENPAPVAQAFSIADVLDNGTAVTVKCPVTNDNTGTVPAASGGVNGKIVCTYEVMQTDTSAKLNTATVTAAGNADKVATDAVEWTETLYGYDSGTLSDARFGYSELINGDTMATFDEQFTCPTDASAYKDGVYEVTYANTAKLNGNLKLEASADVHVKCTLPGLVVSKTAAGTYDRTVTWKLTKSASPAEHVGYAGDTFQSTWTVVADKTEVFGNYKVAGAVTVENPAPVAQAFSIADVLDNGTAVTVKCPVTNDNTGTVPAASGGVNGKVVCTYEVMQTGTSAKLNTATVTAAGNADKVATDAVEWTETLYGYDSGTLSDARFVYSKVISGDKTETFAETFTCPTDASLYKDGKYTSSVTNNAHLNDNINLDASASVGMLCYWPQIEITKTGDDLSKITDKVYYDITVFNNTPADLGLRALSCTISDPKIGYNETVVLASGAKDENLDIEFTIPQTNEDPFINTASVTCSPLGSTFQVSDSAKWSTNLFQPAVEIVKTGPAYATSGDVIVYTFTINNKSSSDSPNLMLDSVSDTVLGDLKAAALAAGCNNLVYNGTCTFKASYTVPDVGLQPKAIKNIVTVHYNPAGFPNDVWDDDDHTVMATPRSQLTDTSFCPLANNQFRLLYHLETAPNIYRLQASNPGQYYFNGFYFGDPGSDFTMVLQVPYPFVTQEGAGVPIQVHDGTGLTSSGCYSPNPSLSGFTIKTPAMSPTSSAGNQIITPEDYTTKNLGSYTTVTVSGKVPATGMAYVTIHLDYGLKKTGSWKQPGTSTLNPVSNLSIADVLNQTGFGSGAVTIHGYEVYNFARTVGGDTATTKPSSYNEFKKFAGFLGFVTDKVTGKPIANGKITIYDPSNKLLTTQYTDADGYYMYAYKHTSKAATYTIKAPAYGKSTAVTVKANGFAAVDFEVDAVTAAIEAPDGGGEIAFIFMPMVKP